MTIDRSAIAGVILAGGLSRRMGGGDKALLDVDGRSMLDITIGRLAPQVATIAINANGDPTRFSRYGLPVIADIIDGHAGPLAGVLTALRWAGPAGYSHVATVASDTPFFPQDLVTRFAAASFGDNGTIALAASGGHRHPVFGLWPVALADDLAEWMETTDTFKVLAWVRRHRLVETDFAIENGIDPFFNANTPQELDQLRAMPAGSAS